MIGVLIVSFFLVVNASLRASIDAFLDDSFSGDFVIDAGSFGAIGLPTEVAEQVISHDDHIDAQGRSGRHARQRRTP